MKTIRTLSVFLAVIFALTAAIQSKAQNQSMLFPVPGTYSTGSTDYDGCKVINFSNSGNSVITDLPRHPFTAFGLTGRPHDEDHLKFASPSINEKYLGQHPMYAQQVVHDKEGNLLFFIVDNNIYNRYGEANKLRMKNKLM
ncbi:MAG: hypothetical protein PHR81_08630 [Bacteroidales bacterium]|jgi:hypothetical protein|nr:hypothetical protein [Bacteroidales bacterium]MDD4214860.1 hypothetical protein [Bacteroidales bacterium]